MDMNPDVQTKWTEALRSGKYKQGRNRLAIEVFEGENAIRNFCCLGVLCELAIEDGVPVVVETDGHQYITGAKLKKYDGSTIDLPQSVVEWAGLNSSDPKADNDARLSHLNDSGYDFDYIAGVIEY